MLALILVVIMRPMPVGSRRFGARSPRSASGVSDRRRALRHGLVDPEARLSGRPGMADRGGGGRLLVGGSRKRWLAAAAGQMALVGGDHQAAARHLGRHEPRRHAFALRHTPHLGSDDPATGRFELCHRASLRRHDPDQVRGVGRSPPAFSAAGPSGSPSVSSASMIPRSEAVKAARECRARGRPVDRGRRDRRSPGSRSSCGSAPSRCSARRWRRPDRGTGSTPAPRAGSAGGGDRRERGRVSRY